MKNIMILVSTLLFTNIAIANQDQLIEDPKMVAELKAIQMSLDNVSTSVMACIESGGKHTDCLCQNKDVITQFNDNVHSFFERNDHMRNADLVRFKADDGSWVTQSLQSFLKQASSGAANCY